MGTLTIEVILEKTKVEDAASVRHLNLWGEQLEDVSVVKQLTNIEVLALASNKIKTLKPFASCETLQELYLRKNSIAALKEVTHLKDLKKLHTLWLMENPCAKLPYYREFVLHCCPQLKQLDGTAVSKEERTQASKKLTPKILDEILGRATSASASPRPSQPRASTGAASPAREQSAKAVKTEKAKPSSSPAPASPRGDLLEARGSTGPVLYTTVQTQRAILLAIVSLLPELTPESLEMLQKEVEERLEKQKSKSATKN